MIIILKSRFNLRNENHRSFYPLPESCFFRELDSEAGEVVSGICHQTECTMMGGEDVTDEQKSEALTLWLGREEWCEQVRCNLWRNPSSVVSDDEL